MDILITEKILQQTDTSRALYLTATCGKVSGCVSIQSDWGVRVICQNVAHKVWKRSGRGFPTVAEALAAYKSPEMKAIIQTAEKEYETQSPPA